ncbi:MAG: thiazole synthase [Chloroflexi bacterium]|nr:thiazole synthase [Chloroflexota bacterium]
MDDVLEIAGKRFNSRLMMGTGKWRSAEEMNAAFEAGRTGIITVAIRRLDLDDPTKRTLLDEIDWRKYQVLPNTAGCTNADEALRTARLGREVTGSDWVKLEVIGDPKYLLPDMDGTLEAARQLVKANFVVLPYIMDDPILARKLQDIGCATVMPLGSPIGSGQGIPHFERIRIIVEQARVPVVVDAGLGAPSDAALAMEIGADAVLVNTAIAKAGNAPLMAEAFANGVRAGRDAFLAGRIPRLPFAEASSPTEGVVR